MRIAALIVALGLLSACSQEVHVHIPAADIEKAGYVKKDAPPTTPPVETPAQEK